MHMISCGWVAKGYTTRTHGAYTVGLHVVVALVSGCVTWPGCRAGAVRDWGGLPGAGRPTRPEPSVWLMAHVDDEDAVRLLLLMAVASRQSSFITSTIIHHARCQYVIATERTSPRRVATVKPGRRQTVLQCPVCNLWLLTYSNYWPTYRLTGTVSFSIWWC